MRVAEERIELIRHAAAARGESVTSFVVGAAAQAAEEELAVERETLVPDGFFDELLHALDDADSPPSELADLARRPRVFTRE